MDKIAFYMINFGGLLLLLFTLGNLGMAQDIYGDEYEVYDSDEDPDASGDFDINNIRFDPDVRNPSSSEALEQEDYVEDESTGNVRFLSDYQFRWDGEEIEDTSDREEFEAEETNYEYDYALAQYNVSDRNDEQIVNVNADDDEQVYITVVEDADDGESSDNVESAPADDGSYNFDLSGERYGFDKAERIEFIMVDDSEVDVSGEREFGNGVVGIANQLISFLNTSYDYIAEVPKFVTGWIDFTASLPGMIGDFLRLYIGLLLVIFILDMIWFG